MSGPFLQAADPFDWEAVRVFLRTDGMRFVGHLVAA